jgi:hypothetical protein
MVSKWLGQFLVNGIAFAQPMGLLFSADRSNIAADSYY